MGVALRPAAVGTALADGTRARRVHLRVRGGVTHQPRPLADEQRDRLIDTLGLAPVTYRPPKRTRVKPPAPKDGEPGWILTRSLDAHGRRDLDGFKPWLEQLGEQVLDLDSGNFTHLDNVVAVQGDRGLDDPVAGPAGVRQRQGTPPPQPAPLISRIPRRRLTPP